jgi:hypothetical protein
MKPPFDCVGSVKKLLGTSTLRLELAVLDAYLPSNCVGCRAVAQCRHNSGEFAPAPETCQRAPHQVGNQLGEFSGRTMKSILVYVT